MLKEIELGKCYRHKISGKKRHVLTYIHTLVFGQTLLIEHFDGVSTSILPINKKVFEAHINEYEKITEKEFLA